MKKLILLAVALTTIYAADAQVLKRLGQRAKNKIEQKAGDKVDKQIDDAVDGKKKDKSENSSQEETTNNSGNNSGTSSQTSTNSSSSNDNQGPDGANAEVAPEPMKAYSKYDFMPGEKVFAYENFAATEIGDFPQRWNTNGTAEVVTLNNKEGKWMKINKEAVFYPEFITDLPENFTLEFDLGVNQGFNSNQFYLNITKLKAPENYSDYGHYVRWQGDHTVHLGFRPAIGIYQGNVDVVVGSNGNHEIQNRIEFKNWNNSANNFGHVSVWRQKERLRVYLNGQKLLDLPKGFKVTSQYNAVTFALYPLHSDNDFYLLGNIRLAVGAPDTRNKLITEGKFVTTGILFDVNEDVIKPESYGTLKAVASVLNENKDVKVKIIGHTDSDGDDKSNLDLSKRRAAAVKNALASEFGVDESRMETDGKGESQPADKNDSVTGKANNRRVEFIKL
ncbi:MAG: OmpA family protein [Chitinophagaceae bacterium]|nr:OmpA family protein [Chitinophagaceae bacterium]